MIKVNLLREYTGRARKARIQIPASNMLVFGALFGGFALVILGLVGFWWYLDTEIKDLTEKKNLLSIEALRLEGYQRDILRYDKLTKSVKTRIEVIEKLKDYQTGPVQLLNYINLSMPSTSSIWLTSVEQKSEKILVTGYAVRQEALPDFMTQLGRAKLFKSVDLEIMEEDKEATRFRLIIVTERRINAE